MEFRILGPVEAWDGTQRLDLGGSRPRAVLASLLVHANEVLSVDRVGGAVALPPYRVRCW